MAFQRRTRWQSPQRWVYGESLASSFNSPIVATKCDRRDVVLGSLTFQRRTRWQSPHGWVYGESLAPSIPMLKSYDRRDVVLGSLTFQRRTRWQSPHGWVYGESESPTPHPYRFFADTKKPANKRALSKLTITQGLVILVKLFFDTCRFT